MLAHSARHLQFVAPKATLYKLKTPMFGDKLFTGHDGVNKASSTIDSFGTKECITFRDKVISKHLALASALRAEYEDIAKKEGYVKANRRFLDLDKKLTINGFSLCASPESLQDLSKALSNKCQQAKVYNPANHAFVVDYCYKLAIQYNLEFAFDDLELEPIINRFLDYRIWKRKLLSLQKITLQNVCRELRQVHYLRSPYSSDLSLKRHKQRKANNKAYLESQIAVNQDGYEATLLDLSDRSTSNPKHRRTELIVTTKGQEVLAKSLGMMGVFITPTLHSAMHRMTKITDKKGKVIKVIPNPKWDGSTPKDGHNYLLKKFWQPASAKLKRNNIQYFGLRVPEPHHDGTPHWHLLLFIFPDDYESLKEILTEYALRTDPDEKGASERRITFERIKEGINPETGLEYSAVGYVIKYICKNVDGYMIDNQIHMTDTHKDWHQTNPYESAEKIETWARDNGIRQFQRLGVTSVQLYREFRRLGEQDGHLETIRQAAADGDWAAFVMAMGGPFVPRKEQMVSIAYGKGNKLNKDTGEIIPVLKTRYGDDAKDRVIGVLYAGMTVLSRINFWEIKDTEEIKLARQKIMTGVVDLISEICKQNTYDISHTQISKSHSDENLFSKSGVLPARQRAPLRQTKSGALDLFQ
jgi:hypothetical protein